MRWSRISLGLALVALSACGGESDEARARREALKALFDSEVSPKEVVAEVNGREIGVSSLVRAVERERGGKDRRAVLDELIVAEVLSDEALAQGHGDSDDIQYLRKQLVVQRLLEQEVEEKGRPSGIPADEVAAYYKANRMLYWSPELRSADHLLVKPSASKWDTSKGVEIPEEVFKACEALAAQIREEIVALGLPARTVQDFEAIAGRWSGRLPADVELHFETLPMFPRREVGKSGEVGWRPTMVEAFADEAFRIGVGELSRPTRTIFGVHILSVTAIEVESEIPLSEAEPGIREFLAERKREKLARIFVEKQVAEARSRIGVNPDLLEKLERKEGESP